ncbi:hypothetical protein ASPWEDRAFT_33155 [Aspergillus wentii DTO 134E9]|uniref:Nephrocystin 3-like N-terminal domain-containing protein n=1 Tax=Aspergillus wentii DTO 134E9 TaxID=1073089 RepID=A0A1L9R4S5_ASPWE|nr:uncharacterized protein ASPWEDRAFT_33155 [Aspergillus wentii DTO 134E9]OJJ29935.1 hypothetical protein ASPWEDRAFT_33155 [Aspergillus wentii DTO 134E9]
MLKRLCCCKSDRADGHQVPPSPVALRQLPRPASGQVAQKPATPKTPISPPAPVKQDASPPAHVDEKPVRRDLWQEAFDALSDDCKKYVSVHEGASTAAAIDDVIQQTEQKYAEWAKEALRIRTHDGNHVDVRDAARKILISAIQAKDAIATWASFDPAGHASAAWRIVSLGLLMVQPHIHRRDAALAASQYLADALAFFTPVDSHRRGEIGSNQKLDDALLGVYTALLDYSAEVNKLREQNPAGNGLTSVAAIADQPLSQLKASVEKKGLGAEKWTSPSNDPHAREVAENILAKIDQSIDRKSVRSKTSSVEEYENIVEWMSTADYSKVQNEMQEARTPETGNWFLNSGHYKGWKASPGSILWLHGASGCGKSVLSSTAIRDIQQFCEEDASRSFAYWYFQFDNRQTQSPESLIRCLIRQFSQKPLAPSVTEIWEEHSSRGTEPDGKTLSKVLHDVLSNVPGETFLVLDALDECPDEPRRKERQTILSLLVDLVEQHKNKLHILATSRPEEDIHAKLGEFPALNVDTRQSEDVGTFLRAKVGEGIFDKFDQQTRTQIIDGILQTGQRHFKWADLQIQRFAQCDTNEQIENALQTIPKNLEDAYQEALGRIQQSDHEKARSIFMLLCLSPMPLEPKTVAAAVDFPAADLVKICNPSLVTVKDGLIRLAHLSIKEFLVIQIVPEEDEEDLEEDPEELPEEVPEENPDEDAEEDPEEDSRENHPCRFTEEEGHTALAKQTVDLLLSTKDGILTEEIAMNQPMLVYSARHWYLHVAALANIHPELVGKVSHIFCEPNIYYNWMRISPGRYSAQDNPWHKTLEQCHPAICQASKMGFYRPVQALLAEGSDPLASFDASGEQNALTEAVKYGHVDILKYMLGYEITIPKASVQHIFGSIDLRVIGIETLQTVFDIFWEIGALRSASEESEDVVDKDIVNRIVQNPSSGPEILEMLLFWLEKPFTLAMDDVLKAVIGSSRPEEIMRMLFEKCNDDVQITPSLMMSFSKKLGVMDILLKKRGAELPLGDEVISYIVANADWKVMDLLLQARGSDIPITEGVLISAVAKGSRAGMIRFIFEKRQPGAEINENILTAAASNPRGQEIMQCLLAELAPSTPLTANVIQTLAGNLESGINMTKMVLVRQHPGFVVSETALEIAASRENNPVEMLQLLIRNGGSDIPITENVVLRAAENPHWGPSVFEYLCELHGNTLPITDKVLVAIANSTHDDATRFLEKTVKRFSLPQSVLEAAYQNLGDSIGSAV